MDDPFDLQRFLDAQEPAFQQARAELVAGRKQTHWMWFIFPQVAGLGNSPTSRRFAITCPEEAKAFLEHPVLGPRLRDCTSIVNDLQGRSALQIFSNPDCMKFHSCMTLFAEVDPGGALFQNALTRYFDGRPDQKTLDNL